MKDFKPRIFKINNNKWVIFDGLCKGCGLCKAICPFGGIEFSKDNKGVYSTPSVSVNPSKCKLCGSCAQVCPDNAIKLEMENKAKK